MPTPVYHLPCTDNAASSAIAEIAGSGASFALGNNAGAVLTSARSQPAGDAPFAKPWLQISGDDRISATVVQASTSALSTGGWINNDQLGSVASRVVSHDTGGYYSVNCLVDDGGFNDGARARMILKNSSGATFCDIATPEQIFNNGWVHVVYGLSPSGGTIRVNGVAKVTTGTNAADSIRGLNGDLNLGAKSDGTLAAATMGIHDFRWYDSYLSDAECLAWMLETLPAGTGALDSPLDSGLQFALDAVPRLLIPHR